MAKEPEILKTIKEYQNHIDGHKADIIEIRQEDFEFPEKMEAADIKNVRKLLGLSQSKFAKVLGADLVTIQKWEQGTRHPTGPARRLMQLIFNYPDFVSLLLADKKKIIRNEYLENFMKLLHMILATDPGKPLVRTS